jgi:hypothetical protein
MTMQDWETRLNRFIEATDREVLQDAGKVTAEIAKAHAESEFEKYRIVQDRCSRAISTADFEREFPSLCFALATGVGKTRLMGAFIAYLHLAHGINNFFVLAPNLTIYNKLIADFTPQHAQVRVQGHRRVRHNSRR